MEAQLASLIALLQLGRTEAAERDAAMRAEAAARDDAMRAEAAARSAEAAARDDAMRAEAAARSAEAAARDDAMRAEAAARDAAMRAEAAARSAEAAARYDAMRAEAAARSAEAAARDRQVLAELAALRAGNPVESPSANSYATVGAEALAALTMARNIKCAAAPPEGATEAERAPIASPADLARLGACTLESEFVAAITPLLRAARGLEAGASADPCALILVNSERAPWLDSLAAPLSSEQLKRPDLFTTWAPFLSGRVFASGIAKGKLAARALQEDGCVTEFYEAKLGTGELTASDFGQLVDYHSRVRGPVRGMLFNARHFWLYQSLRHLPVALIKGELGAPGSLALLRRFFSAACEPPLVPLLRHLFYELHVAPHSIAMGALPAGSGDGGGSNLKRGAGRRRRLGVCGGHLWLR
jgi:hypothetical protein